MPRPRARCWARSRRGRAARGRAQRARTDQPVAEREARPADRRLRHRPDAADAAQPAGVRRVHRGGRLREGEGSLRVAVRRRAGTCRATIVEGRRAFQEARAHRHPAARGSASSTREVERLRAALLRRVGAQLGVRRRRPPTEFRRIAAELKPIFDPRCAVSRRSRRHDGRLRGRASRHQPGAEGHRAAACFRPASCGCSCASATSTSCACCCSACCPSVPHSSGSTPLLLAELQRNAQAAGYRRAEFSWVLEDNRDINQPRRAPARAATRPIASTRRRSREPPRRGHGRHRVHRPPSRRRTSRRAATSCAASCAPIATAAPPGVTAVRAALTTTALRARLRGRGRRRAPRRRRLRAARARISRA